MSETRSPFLWSAYFFVICKIIKSLEHPIKSEIRIQMKIEAPNPYRAKLSANLDEDKGMVADKQPSSAFIGH